jgi:hypothetical protein
MSVVHFGATGFDGDAIVSFRSQQLWNSTYERPVGGFQEMDIDPDALIAVQNGELVTQVVGLNEFFRLWRFYREQVWLNYQTKMLHPSFEISYSTYATLVQALQEHAVREYRYNMRTNHAHSLSVVAHTGDDDTLRGVDEVEMIAATAVTFNDILSTTPLDPHAIFRLNVYLKKLSDLAVMMPRALLEFIPSLLNENVRQEIIVRFFNVNYFNEGDMMSFFEVIGNMGLEHFKEDNITFEMEEVSIAASCDGRHTPIFDTIMAERVNGAVEASRRLRRERQVAFAMGGHPRLGVQSPIKILDGFVLEFV